MMVFSEHYLIIGTFPWWEWACNLFSHHDSLMNCHAHSTLLWTYLHPLQTKFLVTSNLSLYRNMVHHIISPHILLLQGMYSNVKKFISWCAIYMMFTLKHHGQKRDHYNIKCSITLTKYVFHFNKKNLTPFPSNFISLFFSVSLSLFLSVSLCI